MIYEKNIILFGIRSALTSKKNFTVSLSIIKVFWKTKIKSHGDEVTDFYDKKIPKLNHTRLAVITLYSALKKDDNFCPQVFLK